MSIIVNGKEKYRLDDILKEKADINLIYGGRDIGKSYAVKEYLLKESCENPEEKQFAYIRRWSEDIKRKYSSNYFTDIEHLVKKFTYGKYEHISFKEDSFFVSNITKDNKTEYGFKIGRAFSIAMQERYKSLNFKQIKNAIFEEWLTDKIYIMDEPNQFENLLSTIERDREDFRVFMCANTISRVCPYFEYYALSNIKRQKQGTIDIYYKDTGKFDENGDSIIHKIAVEYCKETDTKDIKKKSNKKSGNMIARGEWYSSEHPKLTHNLSLYDCIYTVVFVYNSFKFLLRLLKYENEIVWYVERKTTDIKENERIISNIYNPSPYWTNSFKPLTNEESIAFNLLKLGRIVYCDNLTGQEFNQCFKNL